MLKRIFACALFAGLLAGIATAILQQSLVVPVLMEAELYESGEQVHFQPAATSHSDHSSAQGEASTDSQAAATPKHDDGHSHSHGARSHGEGFDWGRLMLTFLSTILATCAFSLILVSGFAIASRFNVPKIDMHKGILWGLAGYAAFLLAPSMGLPLEVPGSLASEIVQRQIWWSFTAIATLAGIGILYYSQNRMLWVGAIVLVALPHIIGAPHPVGYGGVVPPELSSAFASRALGVGAVSWIILGGLAGKFWEKEQALT